VSSRERLPFVIFAAFASLRIGWHVVHKLSHVTFALVTATALAVASVSASSAAQPQSDALVARFGRTNITLPLSLLTTHSDAIPAPKAGVSVDIADSKSVFVVLPPAQVASMQLCSGMERVSLTHSTIPPRAEQKLFRNTSVVPSAHRGISHVAGAPLNVFQFDDAELKDWFAEPIAFINSHSSEALRRVDLSIQLTEDLRVRAVTFDEQCFFERGADATRAVLKMLQAALANR